MSIEEIMIERLQLKKHSLSHIVEATVDDWLNWEIFDGLCESVAGIHQHDGSLCWFVGERTDGYGREEVMVG